MVDSLEPTVPYLADLLSSALAERGSMSELELVEHARHHGLELGDDAHDRLDEALAHGSGMAWPLHDDDRWVWLPTMLGGRFFTHRLTAAETEQDVLDLRVDLAPLADLLDMFDELADGTPITRADARQYSDELQRREIVPWTARECGALLLPSGYLASRGMAEGEMVSLRLGPDGFVLDPAKPVDATEDHRTLIQLWLRQSVTKDEDGVGLLITAIWSACTGESTLFTDPLAPLTEWLAGCDLTGADGRVAKSGFDFMLWQTRERIEDLADQYDLPVDQALGLHWIVEQHRMIETMFRASARADELAGGPVDPSEVLLPDTARPVTLEAVLDALPLLMDPAVAHAVLFETVSSSRGGAAALIMLSETYEPQVSRSARPALRWLRGKALELLGDAAEAEAAYAEAETLDPDWPPMLIELAHYASDRGDATRALALLRRAGVSPDDTMAQLLERFVAAPRSDIGRNQACWCGSGRKYKQCHLRRESTPLEERAKWLYMKADTFVSERPWLEHVMEVAHERAAFDDDPSALLSALDDPLTRDVVLFEGGAFEDFLATRGYLLPDDERLLAEQWLLVDRSLHEIGQVTVGQGFSARDLRSGDVVEVRERAASRQFRAGHLICARIVPTGEIHQIFGGIEPISMGQRGDLIELLDSEPEPVELAEFLTRRLAPPTLVNNEREPILVCEATLRTTDPAMLAVGLDESYVRVDDQELRWHEHLEADGSSVIRAVFTLQDDLLTISANSAPRMDRALEHVRKLDPAMAIVEQSRLRADEVGDTATSAAPLEPDDPALAEFMEQHMRDYERKWLDESIPALSGYTPRQAAEDPTRRDDLIRLLDSFPHDLDNLATMSPQRLREELGLD